MKSSLHSGKALQYSGPIEKQSAEGYAGTMIQDTIERAARNNASWCDAVCRAHKCPGEFLDDLWINWARTPRFYPNAVTLTDCHMASTQMSTLSALSERAEGRPLAVKDSFSCLDLSQRSFRPLFDAEWISCSVPTAKARTLTRPCYWRQVTSELELKVWECAWNGDPTTKPEEADPRIFKSGLLSDPKVVFLSAWCDGLIVGGGILNLGTEVVGVSNVFTRSDDPGVVWPELINEAAERWPGLPLVGYERGPGLHAARRFGFENIGPLRVWVRD